MNVKSSSRKSPRRQVCPLSDPHEPTDLESLAPVHRVVLLRWPRPASFAAWRVKACEAEGWKARAPAYNCFGGAARVDELLESGEVPADPSPGTRWDARDASRGTGLAAMVADSTPTIGLTTVKCTYETDPIQRDGRAKSRVVYDLHVEGTQNYFANGVLVGRECVGEN